MKYDQIKRAENGAQLAVIYETSLDFEVIVNTENLTKEEVVEFAHMLLKFVGEPIPLKYVECAGERLQGRIE